MKAPQQQNPNIILLNEGHGKKLVIDEWGKNLNNKKELKGTYGRLTNNGKLWFDKYTIEANADDTVFVFGANQGHYKDRTLRGLGQAEQTFGMKNTFPINTMSENDSLEWQYMKRAKNILIEFLQAGGKVVFPVNKDGSTVGTGIAANGYQAPKGKKYAEALAKALLELENIEVVPNPDPINVKKAMDEYIARMDDLEKEYKRKKPAKKENRKSKDLGIGVKMQNKIVNKWLDDEEILKMLKLTGLEKNKGDGLRENPLVNIKGKGISDEVFAEIVEAQGRDQEGDDYLRNLTQSLKVEMAAFNANDSQYTFTKIVSNGGVDQSGNHWFTIHIDKTHKRVQVVDSLKPNLTDDELFNILKDNYQKLGFADQDKAGWGDNQEIMNSAIDNLLEKENPKKSTWKNLRREAKEKKRKKWTSSYEQKIINIVSSVGAMYQAKEPPKWLIKQDNDYDCSLCSIVNYYFLRNPDKTECVINSPDDHKRKPWRMRFELNNANRDQANGMNCYISYNKKRGDRGNETEEEDWKKVEMRNNVLPPKASDLLRSAIMPEYRDRDVEEDIISSGSSSEVGGESVVTIESDDRESDDLESVVTIESDDRESDDLESVVTIESDDRESDDRESDDLESVVTIESDSTGGGDGDDEFNDGIYHPDGLGEGAGNLDIDADFTKLQNVDGVTKWANKRAFYHKEILKPKKFQIGAYFKSLPKTATQGKVAQYLSIIALPITATLSGISGLIGGGFFNPIYIASSHDAWTGIPDYNTASPDFDGNKLEIQRCVTGVLELLDTGCHSKKIEELKHSNPPIKIETQEALGNMVNLLAYKSSEHNLELAMRHSTDDSEKNKLIAYKNIMTKIMTEKKWTMGSSGDLKDFNPKDMRNLVNVISSGDDKHPLMDLINKIENASDQRITKKLKEKFTHMVLHYSNSYSNSLATKYGINNQTVSISDMAYNAGFNLDLIIPRLKSMSMDPAVSQYINPDSLNLLKDYIKSDKRCQRAQRIAQDIHTSLDDKTAIDGVKGELDRKIKACDNRVKFLQTQINGVKPEVQSMIDKVNHKKESLKQSKEKLDIIDTKDDLQQWFIGYSEDIANQRYNYKANEKKPQLKGVKSLEIKAKVYEDGKSYEEKEQKAIKAENDRREIITSYRFIEDANILDNGDIKDVGKAAIELNNFINICEEELKKIPKDNDSADHAWLTVKREGDQNSVKASNEDAREKITKRLEIAEIFYELFSQASTNTTGEEMNLNKVEEVIQNAISCKNELLVVKENDNGEEDEYAISKSAHAIFKKIDDIQKKMSESSHKHHEDESHSHGDDSSHRKRYIDNHYSVQNTVAKRLELAGYQKEFDGLNKGGKSKSISGSSRR
jgi:hypothetical protein